MKYDIIVSTLGYTKLKKLWHIITDRITNASNGAVEVVAHVPPYILRNLSIIVLVCTCATMCTHHSIEIMKIINLVICIWMLFIKQLYNCIVF